ncbi:MAG: hypothetical protein KAH20_07380 [Methylococcales bacterium]|nr:hypothetical protein [Methylococcales bacterium]
MFLGDIKPGFHPYDDPVGDAINKNLFSEQQLKSFAHSIMATKNWLKKRGIEYIYVIVPNKHSIYFDKMPEYISKLNTFSATDQLVSYLQKHTPVNLVDLRPALLEAKKKNQVYFKTDSHWNFYGTNTAQFEIMKKIGTLFPGKIKPTLLKNSQFKIVNGNERGDLSGLAKTGSKVEELAMPIFKQWCNLKPDPKYITTKNFKYFICKAQGLNTIVHGDSFFGALKPYNGRYFHRSIYLPKKTDSKIMQQKIIQEKPNIFIEEVVEKVFPVSEI